MIYVTVGAGAYTEHEFTEFWVDDEHLPNLIAALGLLSNTMTPSEALELV